MNKYHVKHKRQNLTDFNDDCHRFKFWYDEKEMEAICHRSVSVFFSDEDIPEDVKCEVQKKIYNLIDNNEFKWAVPKGAREIADAYCAEEFH